MKTPYPSWIRRIHLFLFICDADNMLNLIHLRHIKSYISIKISVKIKSKILFKEVKKCEYVEKERNEVETPYFYGFCQR